MSEKVNDANGEGSVTSLLREILTELRELRKGFDEHRWCDHGGDCEPASTLTAICDMLQNDDGSSAVQSIVQAIYDTD